MREVIRKPTATTRTVAGRPAAPSRPSINPGLDRRSMLHLQRTVGNRAARQVVPGAQPAPTVARTPDQPGPARSGSTKFAGMALGSNRDGKPVKAIRELGGSQGYDDRLQAISVARLAKADPAAVVLGADQKWHPVETSVAFEVGPASGAARTAAVSEIHGLPSLAGLSAAEQKVTDLTEKLARLDKLESDYQTDPEVRAALKGSSIPIPEAVEAERRKTWPMLAKAKQTRAAIALGVPETEINMIRSITSGRTAAQVNVVETHEKGTPGAGHNPLGGGLTFEEGLSSALSIDQPELADPARAQAMLFHEAQHRSDWEYAQAWIKKYRKETGRIWVKGTSGRKPFEDWLTGQVKLKRLTKADVELVVMETLDSSAYTEARANVRSFLAALQAGDPDGAKRELVGYAHSLKPKKDGGEGQYSSPAPKSEVQAALVVELRAAYAKMTAVMQRQYDAIVAAAMAEYPSAWISELGFAARRGR